ncbi:CHAT domain-containing protein [Psychrosphaera algicola]|uniref:CHAT domain-containing protein n=1 Tax=Psychrosphaera algicola TaxID=3023714 RepID=A0ABT5FJX3_9GAMM|nr:CHAT domain-containing protein [Psychrosphaera sp. G1-22]MDC2891498.1 CHAT domain-containing protein [Psychrosphaera sp. G1-22]
MPFGIARALRVIGVKEVISSIYPLDDEYALEFSTLFYQFIHMGSTSSEALSEVQKVFIKKGIGWHIWSGYQLLN